MDDPALAPTHPLSRQAWMSVLAQARLADLNEHWASLASQPTFTWVRAPQVGAMMVRGRVGNTGQLFNLGEITATRCSLAVEGGAIGVAYIVGRSRRHAALAAMFDAILQRENDASIQTAALVRCLAEQARGRRDRVVAQAYTSKVDFSMLLREA